MRGIGRLPVHVLVEAGQQAVDVLAVVEDVRVYPKGIVVSVAAVDVDAAGSQERRDPGGIVNTGRDDAAPVLWVRWRQHLDSTLLQTGDAVSREVEHVRLDGIHADRREELQAGPDGRESQQAGHSEMEPVGAGLRHEWLDSRRLEYVVGARRPRVGRHPVQMAPGRIEEAHTGRSEQPLAGPRRQKVYGLGMVIDADSPRRLGGVDQKKRAVLVGEP